VAFILNDFINEVQINLSGSETQQRADVSQARIIRALNITQTRIARRRDFDEMERVFEWDQPISGNLTTDRYLSYSQIPALAGVLSFVPRVIYSITISDGMTARRLKGRTPRRFDQIFPDPTTYARDWITNFTRYHDRFEWFPIPDKVYHMRMRAKVWPTDFVASNLGVVSDFVEKDDLITSGATGYIYHSLQEYKKASQHIADFDKFFVETEAMDMDQPDREIVGFPDPTEAKAPSNYWQDPFARGSFE
jgi:hypothetical protein